MATCCRIASTKDEVCSSDRATACQRTARPGPLHRLKRATGVGGLPSQAALTPAPDTNIPIYLVSRRFPAANSMAPTHRAAPASRSRRRSTMAIKRQQDPRAAESRVSRAREGLRVLERTVLLSAAAIYMDYLRDAAIVEVQRNIRGFPNRRRSRPAAARFKSSSRRRPASAGDRIIFRAGTPNEE
jgi:hypothetical protein